MGSLSLTDAKSRYRSLTAVVSAHGILPTEGRTIESDGAAPLRRDLVDYALIGGAAEDGGAVEVFAGFVEDYGARATRSGRVV